jgi:hypothetical protein
MTEEDLDKSKVFKEAAEKLLLLKLRESRNLLLIKESCFVESWHHNQ